jgi:hypothetical protein
MARRFARLRAGAPPLDPGYSAVPSDGMCLNVFLILRSPDNPGRVLLGRLAPDPRWEEVGALDAARIARLGDRWMLPASQLLLLESPEAAVHRIALEQLGIDLGQLPGPHVASEAYRRPDASPEIDPHWDLHFIYVVPGPAHPPRSALWKELDYVPVASTPRASFGRSHGDVLELVGLVPAP